MNLKLNRRNFIYTCAGLAGTFYLTKHIPYYDKNTDISGSSLISKYPQLKFLTRYPEYKEIISSIDANNDIELIPDFKNTLCATPRYIKLTRLNNSYGRLSNVDFNSTQYTLQNPLLIHTSGQAGLSMKVPKNSLILSKSASNNFSNYFMEDALPHYLNLFSLKNDTYSKYKSYVLDTKTRYPIDIYLKLSTTLSDNHSNKINHLASILDEKIHQKENQFVQKIQQTLPLFYMPDNSDSDLFINPFA